jgi:hypothetical protein
LRRVFSGGKLVFQFSAGKHFWGNGLSAEIDFSPTPRRAGKNGPAARWRRESADGK